MGSQFGQVVIEITNIIKLIFQWFFNFINSNPMTKYLFLTLLFTSLISVIISIIFGGGNYEE